MDFSDELLKTAAATPHIQALQQIEAYTLGAQQVHKVKAAIAEILDEAEWQQGTASYLVQGWAVDRIKQEAAKLPEFPSPQ